MKKTITLLLLFSALQLSAQCWQAISVGSDHTLALRSDGTLWAWGDNGSSELGDNTTVNKNQPIQIGTDTNWQKISAGHNFSLAVKANGTLWAWGFNSWGQLGDGTNIVKRVPVQIGTATNWQNVSASSGTTGGHALAIKTNGTLWGWGRNNYGQLGDNTLVDKNQPTQIGTETNWAVFAAGGNHSLAIKSNGTLWTWGWNGTHQLGDGTNVDKSIPTQIGTATNWQSIDGSYTYTLAIKTNGTLWAWGYGSDGQLGLGALSINTTPSQVGDNTDWVKATAGIDHSLALKTNNTLWSWGQNENGQLGLGTNNTTDITVPTLVSTNADKTIISAGKDFSMIINSDGFLYAVGLNTEGELGDGTNTDRNILTNIACSALAVSQFEGTTQIKAYPNPVKDVLTLSASQEITSVSIYNLFGQEMIGQTVQSQEASLDVSVLSNGTYFVKVTSGSESQTLKIIKQ